MPVNLASRSDAQPSFVLIHTAPTADVAAIDKQLQSLVTGDGSVLFALNDGWYAVSRAPGKELRVAHGGDNDALAMFLGGIPGIDGVSLVPADELVRRYEERGPNPAAPAIAGAPNPSMLWNLDTVRARQAWALMGGIDNIDWGSVRVGHLDTGYTEHEVFGPWTNGFSPSLLPQVGINTFDGWQGTMDPLSPRGTPGHGTRTCSVLTGRRDNVFLGVAPRVPVVPYRVTDFVVIDTLGWQNRMGQSINHAVLDGGCTILSISLGDPCYAPTEMGVAVDAAYERGVIIVAAAGNYTSEVTYPGRYSRTIAAGGITKRDEPWSGGSRGVSVDLCAPAADVWRADPIRNNDGSVATSRYGDNGDGTSYATVHVSGAAALWKAHHGAKLDDLYAARPWQYVEAFRTVIKSTARKPAGWNDKLFGAGILNIEATLQAPLPNPNTLVKQDRLAALEHF
jgi:subtilisin family serine protease